MISVIITTHNRRELLLLAIESVLQQSYQDFECIIIDDASDENIEKVILDYKDTRLKYYYISQQESNGGNYARNLGIKMSVGNYIAFLDDDDIWLPHKLEYQKKLLDSKAKIGMVYCQMIKDYIQEGVQKKIIPDISCRGDCSKKVFVHIPCTTSAIMVRKEVLQKVGIFDEKARYWQEYDLCIRICQQYEIDFVKKYLVKIRCDLEDKSRLTNKFYDWIAAVKYQNHKYSDEIHALPQGMQKSRKKMIYTDAAIRCRNSGNKRAQRFYLRKIYSITHENGDFWNYIFNDVNIL